MLEAKAQDLDYSEGKFFSKTNHNRRYPSVKW